jgi:hypothetical protein
MENQDETPSEPQENAPPEPYVEEVVLPSGVVYFQVYPNAEPL